MRIVIDGRMLYWTGVGRYTLALLEELQAIDHDNEYIVLVRAEDWKIWTPTEPNFRKTQVSINPYTFAEQLKLPGIIKGFNPDLVHFPAPNAPVMWFGRRVSTIHDLTLIDYDTNRRGGVRPLWQLKRLAFRAIFWNSVKSAAEIITDTEYVKKQLQKRYEVKRNIRHIWLAADEVAAEGEPVKRIKKLTGDYLFYVGNSYPYKNIDSMIRALALLPEEHEDVQLVIGGKRDAFSAASEKLAKELKVSKRVVFTGYLSDGELVTLVRGAAAYINPSLSEGFGLQGLEAMAVGTPVLAARASCLPEVYGEAAEYFSPHDPADQAEAMARVLSDNDVRKRLVAEGTKRVMLFSWRRMAEQTLDVYTKAVRKR